MPLDINLFRVHEGGDPEKVKESQRRRFEPVEVVDEIIELDTLWRKAQGDADNLRRDRNKVQKAVGAKMKAKEPCDDMKAEIKEYDAKIIAQEAEVKRLGESVNKKLGTVGNLVELTVPVEQNEDFNRIERTFGKPRSPEGLLNHHDLLWRIGGYEPERGVGVAGHRGYFLKDAGVMLNQAFINYGIAFLQQRKYNVLQPPYMMKKSVMSGVAQLEQFDEELYKVSEGDEANADSDKYLIATSEQPICAYHKGDWLEPKNELPVRYAGVSTCFRKEAGKHGADTWGIFRVHQFEKVEQFCIVDCDLETSNKMQEEMIKTAEEFYQSLDFPYHVINIVSGALNNAATRKWDLECWFPGYNAYRELVSCSNCTDYQSRSMEIRCGQKKLGDREKKYVHMLNATLCATGRAICCLLENYQESDGVRVPDVLVPYMGGRTFLPFVRESRIAAKPERKGGKSSEQPQTAKAPKAPKAAAAAAAAAAPAPAAAPPAPPVAEKVVDPKVAALTAAVSAQAEIVRAAKKEKKLPKNEVDVLVQKLLALKADLGEATGEALYEMHL
jgi:seryl-tRNA synthetase